MRRAWRALLRRLRRPAPRLCYLCQVRPAEEGSLVCERCRLGLERATAELERQAELDRAALEAWASRGTADPYVPDWAEPLD